MCASEMCSSNNASLVRESVDVVHSIHSPIDSHRGCTLIPFEIAPGALSTAEVDESAGFALLSRSLELTALSSIVKHYQREIRGCPQDI